MKRILVYEYAFITFGLFCCLLGLITQSDIPFSLELGGISCLYLLYIKYVNKLSVTKWRFVVGFSFIFYVYQSIHKIVCSLQVTTKDSWLLQIDEFLFAKTPSIYMESFISKWFTDANSIFYLLYDIYLMIFLVWYLLRSVEEIHQVASFLFNAFFVGFVLYILVPAVGPRYAYPQLYICEVTGGMITKNIQFFIENASPGYDVFPSLHTMILLVMLNCDYHLCRLRYYVMLPCAFLIIFSTLYLRYHYAVDVICGVIVFMWLRKWFDKYYGWRCDEF